MLPQSLILASSSPRRADLLQEWKIPFIIRSPSVEEHDARSMNQASPRRIVLANAKLKAESIARQFPNSCVLGADTLVVLDGKIFGKPKDMHEAQAMLMTLVGRTHQVLTAVCIFYGAKKRRCFTVTTDVRFKQLSADQISEYLQLIKPLDKAGAYAAQEYRDLIIEEINGSFTNVVGLPMERLTKELVDFRKRMADCEI